MVKLIRIFAFCFGLTLLTLAGGGQAADTQRSGNARLISVTKPGQMQSTGAIAIRYDLSAQTIYAQQMLEIDYVIETNDAFITLRIDQQSRVGESYAALEMGKTELPQGVGKRYRYDLKVIYHSGRVGTQAFKAPDLIYSEGGRDRVRFSFTPQTVQVFALPPYLPPYIPMGTLALKSTVSQRATWFNPLFTGKVYFWDIRLRVHDISPASIPDLRQQLIGNRGLRFLPAEVSLSRIRDPEQLIHEVHYSIPFTVQGSGRYRLPELRIQSFDVSSKRMRIYKHSHGHLYALSPGLYWGLLICVLAVFLFVIWRIWPVAQRIYRNVRALQQAHRQLRAAETAKQMRKAMQTFAVALGWPVNLSLSDWLQYWQRTIKHDSSMDTHIGAMQHALYSADATEPKWIALRDLFRSTGLRQLRACISVSL